MSHTTVLALYPNDRWEDIKEFPNSWGSAPVIWDYFCKKYLQHEYWNPNILKKVWPMWKDLSIPEHERVVLFMTYDRAYILKKDYQRAAEDLKKYLKINPWNPESVNHWPEIKQIFKSDPDVPAIGFWHTSVSECPFDGEWVEEDGEEVKKMITWDECYNLYGDIDSLKEKNEKIQNNSD